MSLYWKRLESLTLSSCACQAAEQRAVRYHCHHECAVLHGSCAMHLTQFRWRLFSGCTLAVGVANGQVYFAHVRPLEATTAPATDPNLLWHNSRVDLAAGLHNGGSFEGVTIANPAQQFITVGGRAANEVSSCEEAFFWT